MKFFKNNNVLIIPSYITIFFYFEYSILILKYQNIIKYVQINTKSFFIIFNINFLYINLKSKLIKSSDNIFVKNQIYELTIFIYKKLMLVGVEFKVFKISSKNYNFSILIFKLGLSHFIYFKLKNTVFYIFQKHKLYFLNYSFKNSLFLISKIKQLKLPNFYKNKGVFYYNEKLIKKKL